MQDLAAQEHVCLKISELGLAGAPWDYHDNRLLVRAYDAPKAEEMRIAREFFAQGGSLEEFCLAMLNRNEFVYAP